MLALWNGWTLSPVGSFLFCLLHPGGILWWNPFNPLLFSHARYTANDGKENELRKSPSGHILSVFLSLCSGLTLSQYSVFLPMKTSSRPPGNEMAERSSPKSQKVFMSRVSIWTAIVWNDRTIEINVQQVLYKDQNHQCCLWILYNFSSLSVVEFCTGPDVNELLMFIFSWLFYMIYSLNHMMNPVVLLVIFDSASKWFDALHGYPGYYCELQMYQ